MQIRVKIKATIEAGRIRVTEPSIDVVYFIEQDGDRFYVTSTSGYDGYEGNGHTSIESAFNELKSSIKNKIRAKLYS